MDDEARSALADIYQLLRAVARRKPTAPSCELEAVDVDSPHSLASQERKADAMNSSRNQPPALDAARSDRSLGAQSRPGTAAAQGAAP